MMRRRGGAPVQEESSDEEDAFAKLSKKGLELSASARRERAAARKKLAEQLYAPWAQHYIPYSDVLKPILKKVGGGLKSGRGDDVKQRNKSELSNLK